MVELARRAVAAELRDIDLRRRARPCRAARRSVALCSSRIAFSMQSAPRLFDLAAHEQPRLVDRIAERIAGVAEHHEIAGLRHEGRHVADRALHDDVDALHRDAAARRGVAVDDQQAAAAGRAGRLLGVALHVHAARHHVLGDAGAGVAVDDDGRAACSCRRSNSRRARRSRS